MSQGNVHHGARRAVLHGCLVGYGAGWCACAYVGFRGRREDEDVFLLFLLLMGGRVPRLERVVDGTDERRCKLVSVLEVEVVCGSDVEV